MSIFAFDLIHYDVWGPFAQPTQNGFRYFLSIVDDSTRSTWIYHMKHKSETRFLLQPFYNMICTQFNTKIKAIRTDNLKEFFMKDFCCCCCCCYGSWHNSSTFLCCYSITKFCCREKALTHS